MCYEENFDKACRTFDADVTATVSALFRKGSADGKRKRSRTAHVRHNGSWFGGADKVPGLPIDRDVLSEEELQKYVASLQANGLSGPNACCMNHCKLLSVC